ncbi:SPOR domain-containing protein [Crocinitomix catalasitica]|uniref:SPOR domain-containing protein n=1 Tax=Crocinitomix catalasitica TaxID=184607 RepID=UPI000688ECEB|nr:SPOR domain-containing protein [Crocinitomix catalasitica]
MNKYLIDILKAQGSVIIPGLGSLMVPSQKSGKVVFNPHLKFNDGSLAKYIAEKEEIELQDAQNKMAKHVREIEAELGKGNDYAVFELGVFTKNTAGDIVFTMDKDVAILTDDAPKSTEKKVDKVKSKTDKKSVEKPKEIVSKAADIVKDSAVKSKDVADKTAKSVSDKVSDTVEELKKAKAEAKDKIDAIVDKVEDKKDAIVEDVKKSKETIFDKLKNTPETVDSKKDKVVESIKDKVEESKVSKQSLNKYVPNENLKEDAKKFSAKANSIVKETEATLGVKPKDSKKVEKEKVVIVEKEKKKRAAWPWILLLFLIGLGVAGYFYKGEIMNFVGMGDHNVALSDSTNTHLNDSIQDANLITSEDLENANMDSSDSTQAIMNEDGTEATTDEGLNEDDNSADAIEEEAPVEEPVVESKPVVQQSSGSGNFHLIGNSFEEKGNADRFLADMKSKGHPARIIGQFDGLYLVSLNSFPSSSAAYQGKSSVSNDAPSAWVFKWPK